MKKLFETVNVGHTSPLTNILDSITDGFFFVNNEWNIVFINQSASKLMGRSAASLVNKNLWEIFPKEDHEFFYNQYVKAKESNQPVIFETYYAPYEKWVMIKAYPSPDGLAIYFLDITTSKQLSNELNVQKKRLEVLYNKGADMVAIVDLNGIYQFVSSNVERIFGYKPEELIGRSGFELIHPEDASQVADKLQELTTGDEVLMNEFRFLDKHGNWRWVEVLGTNMLNDPTINGIIINSREITSWKEKDQQLRKAFESITAQNEKLREIAFIQSHEVRKPVANILSLLDVLEKISVEEKDKPVIEMLKRSIQQLDDMIRKIVSLTYSINELVTEGADQ